MIRSDALQACKEPSAELSPRQDQPEILHSPCIGVCALDDDDICIGCWRSGREITDWGRLDNAGKRAILQNVARRQR